MLLPAVVAFAIAGCGYYKTTSRTAKDIKTIAVPFFENKTLEPSLEILVTELIILELINDNTLNVVSEDEADAVLDGSIVEYFNIPFSFNRDLNAEEYHVIITVSVTLFSRRLNEPIWENQTIKGDGSYFIGIEDVPFEAAQIEAVKEITDRILNLTVQDW